MQKRMKRAGNRIFTVLILIFLMFTAYILCFPSWEKREAGQRDIDRLEAHLASLKQENKDLKQEVKNLNDPDYIETVARKDLGLVKEGEIAYIVAGQDEEEPPLQSGKKPVKNKTLLQQASDWLQKLTVDR